MNSVDADQQSQLQVPSGFPELVKDLSREVLRAQPQDIYQFCATYFQNRLKNSGKAPNNTATAASSSSSSKPNNTSHSQEEPDNQQQQQEPPAQDNEEEMSEHSPIPSDVDSEEDDVQMPLPPPPTNAVARGRRTSVSAESMAPSNEEYTKVVIPKSDEQRARIGAAVKNNFLFRNLDEEQYKDVIDAMAEKRVQPGEEVIKQGGVGDFFYIIESGTLQVLVAKFGKPAVKVAEVGSGGSFGELALMYNAPRAATVSAISECILWALDRITFRRILMDSTSKKRRMYESFLEEVPLLKSLEAYERHKIADALESVTFNDGETVIKQGDPGDNFYIIESGDAVVTLVDEEGKQHTLRQLKKGDYFGELALLSNKPRAATITAVGKLKCATLGKKAFDRLLGPALDIIKRNTSTYKTLAHRKSIEELVERIEAGINVSAPNGSE